MKSERRHHSSLVLSRALAAPRLPLFASIEEIARSPVVDLAWRLFPLGWPLHLSAAAFHKISDESFHLRLYYRAEFDRKIFLDLSGKEFALPEPGVFGFARTDAGNFANTPAAHGIEPVKAPGLCEFTFVPARYCS